MDSFSAADAALASLSAPSYDWGSELPPGSESALSRCIRELWPHPTDVPISHALLLLYPLVDNDFLVSDMLACASAAVAVLQRDVSVEAALHKGSLNTQALPATIARVAEHLHRATVLEQGDQPRLPLFKVQTGVLSYLFMSTARLKALCAHSRPSTITDALEDLPQSIPDALSRVVASYVGFLHRFLHPDCMRVLATRDRALRALFRKFASQFVLVDARVAGQVQADAGAAVVAAQQEGGPGDEPGGPAFAFTRLTLRARTASVRDGATTADEDGASAVPSTVLRVSWSRLRPCLELMGMFSLLSERTCKAVMMQTLVYELSARAPTDTAALSFLSAIDASEALPDSLVSPLPATAPTGESPRTGSGKAPRAGGAVPSSNAVASAHGRQPGRRRRSSLASVTAALKYMSPAVALGDECLMPFSLQDVLDARRAEKEREGRDEFVSTAAANAPGGRRPASPTALLRTGGNFIDFDDAEGDLILNDTDPALALHFPAFCAFFARCADILYEEQLFAASRGSAIPRVTEPRLRARKPWDSAALQHKLHKLLVMLHVADVAAPSKSALAAQATASPPTSSASPLRHMSAADVETLARTTIPSLQAEATNPETSITSTLGDVSASRIDFRPVPLRATLPPFAGSAASVSPRSPSPSSSRRPSSAGSSRPLSASRRTPAKLSVEVTAASPRTVSPKHSPYGRDPRAQQVDGSAARAGAARVRVDGPAGADLVYAPSLVQQAPVSISAVADTYARVLAELAPSALQNPFRTLGIGVPPPPLRVVEIAEGKAAKGDGAKGKSGNRNAGSNKVSADRAPIFVDFHYDPDELVARDEFRALQRQVAAITGFVRPPQLPEELAHLRQNLKVCMNPEVLKPPASSTKSVKNPGKAAAAAAATKPKAQRPEERPPWDGYGVLRVPPTHPLTNVCSMVVHAAVDGVPIESAVDAEKVMRTTARAEVEAVKERKMTEWLLREKAKKQKGRGAAGKPARRAQKGVLVVNVDAMLAKTRAAALQSARTAPADITSAAQTVSGMYYPPPPSDAATGPIAVPQQEASATSAQPKISDAVSHAFFGVNAGTVAECAVRVAAGLLNVSTSWPSGRAPSPSPSHVAPSPRRPGTATEAVRRPSFTHRTTRPLSATRRAATVLFEDAEDSVNRTLEVRVTPLNLSAVHRASITYVPPPSLDSGYPFLRTAPPATSISSTLPPIVPSLQMPTAPAPPASALPQLRSPTSLRMGRAAARPPSASLRPNTPSGSSLDAAAMFSPKSSRGPAPAPTASMGMRSEDAFRRLQGAVAVGLLGDAPSSHRHSLSPRRMQPYAQSITAAGVPRYPRLVQGDDAAPPTAPGRLHAFRDASLQVAASSDRTPGTGMDAPPWLARPIPSYGMLGVVVPASLRHAPSSISNISARRIDVSPGARSPGLMVQRSQSIASSMRDGDVEDVSDAGAEMQQADSPRRASPRRPASMGGGTMRTDRGQSEIIRAIEEAEVRYESGEYAAARDALQTAMQAVNTGLGESQAVVDLRAYIMLYRAATHARLSEHAHSMACALEAWQMVSADRAPQENAAANLFQPSRNQRDKFTNAQLWMQALALAAIAECAYRVHDVRGAALYVAASQLRLQAVARRLNDADGATSSAATALTELTLSNAVAEANLAACMMLGGAYSDANAAYSTATSVVETILGISSPLCDAIISAHERMRAAALRFATDLVQAQPGRIMKGDERHLATDATYVVELPARPATGPNARKR